MGSDFVDGDLVVGSFRISIIPVMKSYQGGYIGRWVSYVFEKMIDVVEIVCEYKCIP